MKKGNDAQRWPVDCSDSVPPLGSEKGRFFSWGGGRRIRASVLARRAVFDRGGAVAQLGAAPWACGWKAGAVRAKFGGAIGEGRHWRRAQLAGSNRRGWPLKSDEIEVEPRVH